MSVSITFGLGTAPDAIDSRTISIWNTGVEPNDLITSQVISKTATEFEISLRDDINVRVYLTDKQGSYQFVSALNTKTSYPSIGASSDRL